MWREGGSAAECHCPILIHFCRQLYADGLRHAFCACLPSLLARLQFVLGFMEPVLWASLATLIGGCLVYVKSAHDEARKAAAALVRDAGAHISRWGSGGGRGGGVMQPRRVLSIRSSIA